MTTRSRSFRGALLRPKHVGHGTSSSAASRPSQWRAGTSSPRSTTSHSGSSGPPTPTFRRCGRIYLAVIVAATSVAVASAAVPGGNLRTAERFVARHCHHGSMRSKNMWETDRTFRFNALYGDCGGGDGHDQRIWFFAVKGARFIGTDTRT